MPGVTTSDHRVLETRIKRRDTTEIGESEKHQPSRFLLTRVDRERCDRCLKESVDTILSGIEISDEDRVECLANSFSKAIVDACEASMPRKKWSKKSHPWWNRSLTRMKYRVCRLLRKYRRNKSDANKLSYFTCLRQYRREIRKAPYQSWKRFVTEEGNKNTWSVIYKIQTDKLKVQGILSSLKRKDGSITTERHEVAERLMKNFVINSCDQRPTGDFDEARGEFPPPGDDETEFTRLRRLEQF